MIYCDFRAGLVFFAKIISILVLVSFNNNDECERGLGGSTLLSHCHFLGHDNCYRNMWSWKYGSKKIVTCYYCVNTNPKFKVRGI